ATVLTARHQNLKEGADVMGLDADFVRSFSGDPRPIVQRRLNARRVDCPSLTTVPACAFLHGKQWTGRPLKADNIDVVEAVAVLPARNCDVGVITVSRETRVAGE